MTGIPERVGRLFHRYRWENLRLGAHAEFIIPTVLDWGDWQDVRWLFGAYGWDRIREWVASDAEGMQSLPESVQVLWTTVFLGQPVYQAKDLHSRWGPRRTVPADGVPDWLRAALARWDGSSGGV